MKDIERPCRPPLGEALLADFADEANLCRKNTCIREAVDSPGGTGT
jgi:hypothetical protein